MDADHLRHARRLLSDAERAAVLTGAGVSADSGVSTFRGEDGLWKEHRPEELATPGAFRRDPRLVWEWYARRREAVAACEPNEAHRALARWTVRSAGVWILTQNVDDLHLEALEETGDDAEAGSDATGGGGTSAGVGTPAGGEASAGDAPAPRDRLLELHGSLFRVRCTGCGRRRAHREPIDASSRDALPRCTDCGSLLRPDVVWFGESLDPEVLERARRAARAADLCLVVGTSGAVEPAASLARVAARSGAAVVEVDPERTALSALADVTLRTGAAEAVPALLEER